MMTISQNPAASQFFGVRFGGFGAVGTVLVSVAIAALTFFLVTFVSIFGIMIYNAAGHHVSYAFSYRRIALPAGVVALLLSVVYLGFLWMRRNFSLRADH